MTFAKPGPREKLLAEDAFAMRNAGRFAEAMRRFEVLEKALEAAGEWESAGPLLAEIRWCKRKAAELEEAVTEKLVVTLAGPSGAGKSTLLNALAGEVISRTGLQRPTTRSVVVVASDPASAGGLLDRLGADKVEVASPPGSASALEHMILVDAPDTNTLPENQALLLKVLESTDVVLAVFNAENPKLHDNIVFLRPLVAHFPGKAVVPVLNRVDRIELGNLQNEVIPDFAAHIQREWGLEKVRCYAVSAKAALSDCAFPEDEKPLHSFNEFGDLAGFLKAEINRAGMKMDLRIERAQGLAVLCVERVAEVLEKTTVARQKALEALVRFQAENSQVAFAALERVFLPGRDRLLPVMYRELAGRWWGPVGWLTGLWSRIAAGRSREGGMWEAVKSFAHPERLSDQPASDLPVKIYELPRRTLYAERWPLLADALVEAGFPSSIRASGDFRGVAEEDLREMASRWEEAARTGIDSTARTLSHPAIQWVFNLPIMTLAAWILFQTVTGFVTGDYLPQNYFDHALVALGLVWGGVFVAFQLLVKAVAGEPLRRKIRRLIESTSEPGILQAEELPWKAALLSLQRLE